MRLVPARLRCACGSVTPEGFPASRNVPPDPRLAVAQIVSTFGAGRNSPAAAPPVEVPVSTSAIPGGRASNSPRITEGVPAKREQTAPYQMAVIDFCSRPL